METSPTLEANEEIVGAMVKITFIGQAAFLFEANGQTVLTDPFIDGNPAATIAADSLNPNTILISHAHGDHLGNVLSIAQRTGAAVITIVEIAEYLHGKGLKNVNAGNFGGTIAFEGGSAKFVPAWHTSSFTEDGKKVAISIPAGFIIRFGGKAIYFAGDTALFGDMKLIGEEGIDLAILPIGGHYTMDPGDAVRAAKLVGAKFVIPGHYNTFPAIQQDPQAFKADLEARTGSKGVVLAPGESFELN
jgi:L-ascorbate metabolism protein UlaG (beta-lactamase superfamily)